MIINRNGEFANKKKGAIQNHIAKHGRGVQKTKGTRAQAHAQIILCWGQALVRKVMSKSSCLEIPVWKCLQKYYVWKSLSEGFCMNAFVWQVLSERPVCKFYLKAPVWSLILEMGEGIFIHHNGFGETGGEGFIHRNGFGSRLGRTRNRSRTHGFSHNSCQMCSGSVEKGIKGFFIYHTGFEKSGRGIFIHKMVLDVEERRGFFY